jgi:HEAT repeat protein
MVEPTLENAGVIWRRAGKRLGLCGPGLLTGLQLDGGIGRHSVRVGAWDGELRIVTRDDRPSALSQLAWRTGAYPGLAPTVAIGDAEFDERVAVLGNPVTAAALFDAPLRVAILRIATTGAARFEHGILNARLFEVPQTVRGLVSAVRTIVALARRLVAPSDLATSLASNARQDPVAGVRLRCLDRLCEAFPKSATRALRAALRDPDPSLRLRAASALPRQGRSVLLALARASGLDEAAQARAIAAIDHPPPRELIRILSSALGHRSRRVVLAAVAALGASGSRSAVAPLARLAGSVDAEIRLAAIRALGATRQPAAQGALLKALGSQSSEARDAAAEGLGALGSVAAVAALHAAVDVHPLDVGFRRLARRATEAIQARAAGAAAGQLSVAEDALAGGLSLASADAGRLTLDPGSGMRRRARNAARARRNG